MTVKAVSEPVGVKLVKVSNVQHTSEHRPTIGDGDMISNILQHPKVIFEGKH